MNALVLPQARRIPSAWRDKAHARLFLGAQLIGLAAILTIFLHAADPQHVALGATTLGMLLAMRS